MVAAGSTVPSSDHRGRIAAFTSPYRTQSEDLKRRKAPLLVLLLLLLSKVASSQIVLDLHSQMSHASKSLFRSILDLDPDPGQFWIKIQVDIRCGLLSQFTFPSSLCQCSDYLWCGDVTVSLHVGSIPLAACLRPDTEPSRCSLQRISPMNPYEPTFLIRNLVEHTS